MLAQGKRENQSAEKTNLTKSVKPIISKIINPQKEEKSNGVPPGFPGGTPYDYTINFLFFPNSNLCMFYASVSHLFSHPSV